MSLFEFCNGPAKGAKGCPHGRLAGHIVQPWEEKVPR